MTVIDICMGSFIFPLAFIAFSVIRAIVRSEKLHYEVSHENEDEPFVYTYNKKTGTIEMELKDHESNN